MTYHKRRNKAIKILNTKIPTDPYKIAIFPVGIPYSLQKPKNPYRRDFSPRVATLLSDLSSGVIWKRLRVNSDTNSIVKTTILSRNLAGALHFGVCVKWQSHQGMCQQQQINIAEGTRPGAQRAGPAPGKSMRGGTRTEVRVRWMWSPSSIFPHQNRPIFTDFSFSTGNLRLLLKIVESESCERSVCLNETNRTETEKESFTTSGVQRGERTGRRPRASKAGGHPKSKITKIKIL